MERIASILLHDFNPMRIYESLQCDRTLDRQLTAKPVLFEWDPVVMLAGKNEKADDLVPVGFRELKKPVVMQQVGIQLDPGWPPVAVVLEFFEIVNTDKLHTNSATLPYTSPRVDPVDRSNTNSLP